MADVKISALPAASTPLTGGEVLPVVQSGVTTKVAVSNLTAGLSGTASININGTVGATTPTTGAFTSGTFSTTLGVTGTSTLAAVNASGVVTVTMTTPEVISKSSAAYSNGVNGGYIEIQGLNSSSSNDNLLSIHSVATAGVQSTTTFANIGATFLTAAGTAVTIPGTLGVGGYSAYVCRAWVNFNGTGTVAINGSQNVSSITDNGAGDYTVNFTVSMANALYTAVGSCSAQASSYAAFVTMNRTNGGSYVAPTAAAQRLNTVDHLTYAAADNQNVSVAIII